MKATNEQIKEMLGDVNADVFILEGDARTVKTRVLDLEDEHIEAIREVIDILEETIRLFNIKEKTNGNK